MSRISVTVTGRGADGNVSTRTLTERSANVWSARELDAGEYGATATAEAERLTGSATGTVSPGQTARIQIVLRPQQAVAAAFVVHFRFDSAFVEPCMRAVLGRALGFAASSGHTADRLLVVGHTDRVGPGDYNQSLSERRARAVFAFLTFGRDPDGAVREWTAIRQTRPAGTVTTLADSWGVREYQWMLQDLGWYPGTIDGDKGTGNSLTNQAIRAFRCHKGLPPGTHVDDELWEALIRDYLGQDSFALGTARLLPNCPGEPLKWLGCGEEDPVNNTPSAHRPNRRVELLFVTGAALPCRPPEPDTFRLPAASPAGTAWCIGPPPANSGHACFLARGTPQPGRLLFQPAEPAVINAVGRVSREVRQPDGSVALERVASRPIVAITAAGEFQRGEQGRGEPSPDTTRGGGGTTGDPGGTFGPYAGKPEGIWTLEVLPQPRSQPVLLRLEDDEDGPVRGGVVCRRLHDGDLALNVVIVAAPGVREIRVPAVAHVMTALHPTTRQVRTCAGFGGAAERQASSLGDDQVRAAFDAANRTWRQGRIRFELADIVHEAYAFRTDCEVDGGEFAFLLDRCAYPRAVNVFFVGDLAGNGEAGFGLSPEDAASQGLAISGCAVGDRFQTTILGPPISTPVDEPLREQVLAHELGHFLNLPHVTGAAAADPNRLMQPSGSTGANRLIAPDEVTVARGSQGAADDCTPLSLTVTGAARVGGTLSHRFVFVRDPASPATVTADAVIPDAMLDPARGALVMAGGTAGANPKQQVVPTGTPATVEITATYTPVGGTPVVRRVFVHVVDFDLAVDGAVRLGATTTFFAVQDATRVVTVRAELSSTPFCIPDTLVVWMGATRVDDPLRVTVSRASPGPFPVTATVAGITRTRTILVGALTLRVEGEAIQVSPGVFATARRNGTLTVVAVFTPAAAPPPPVVWVGASPTAADPLRATFVRNPAGRRTVTATVGDTTVSADILVEEVRRYTQTAPAGQSLDLLSDPAEPVLRVCVGAPADLTVDVEPDTGPVFYTTTPANVVDLAPTSGVGDGAVTVTPRPLPAGTDRAVGAQTRVSTRVMRADGAELPRQGAGDAAARVRVRVFDERVVVVLLHVVRRDDGTQPAGVTLAGIVAGLNAALDTANRLWRQACVRFRMRQRAGTAPRDSGWTAADLEIDFIDATDRLDISATYDPTTGAVTTAEEDDLFSQGGRDRNADNPRVVNLFVIERFVGAGTLGGIGGANHVTIQRTDLNGATLLAHEIGHCMNLPDLSETTITNIDQRVMRSATPRGELLASGGVAGDEITIARRRAPDLGG
jgi:outer membrane protein OmpA-like peptidoglycan-associated protein